MSNQGITFLALYVFLEKLAKLFTRYFFGEPGRDGRRQNCDCL